VNTSPLVLSFARQQPASLMGNTPFFGGSSTEAGFYPSNSKNVLKSAVKSRENGLLALVENS